MNVSRNPSTNSATVEDGIVCEDDSEKKNQEICSIEIFKILESGQEWMATKFFDPSSIKYLHLSNCRLESIDPRLALLTNLLEVDLSGNQLSSLPETLIALRNLQTLNLAGNSFEIAPLCVTKLTTLVNLDLSKNPLRSFEELPSCLGSLRRLILSHTLIRRFPKWLFTNVGVRLEVLNLSNSQCFHYSTDEDVLQHFKNSLYFFSKSLKKLDLSLCCASPGDLRIVSYFDNIQFLNVGNDEVDESSNSKLRNRLYDLLLSSILNQDTLTNLVSLSVSNASLSTLSEDIGLLSSLRILDVSGNHLNWLPNNFSKLFNLETLDASHNHLKTFPPDFSNLSNLRSLLVSENRLDSVPVDFDKLVLLEHADFYSNLIEEFPREAIESLVKHRLLGLDFAWNFCDPPDESLYVRLRESYRSWFLHRYVSSVEKMKRSSYRRVSIKELPAIENWAVIHDTEGSYLFSDDENSSEDDGNVSPSDGEYRKNLTSPNVKYDQNLGSIEVEEGENLRLAESKLDPNGNEEGNWDDEDLFSERFDPSRLDLPLRSTTILSIYEAKGPTPPVQYYIRDDLGPFRYPYHHMAFCPSDVHPPSIRYGMRSLPQNCSFTIDDEQFEDV